MINKKKLYQWCQKYLTADNIKIIILFFPLCALLANHISSGKNIFDSLLDVNILISFIFVFFCNAIATAVSHFVEKKVEDGVKLTENYSQLVKKYNRSELLTYNGKDGNVVLPEIELCFRTAEEPPFIFEFDHNSKDKHYKLPTQIADNSDWLMKAHSHSVIYNNMNVRLSDLDYKDGKVKLLYEKTTYFDSLITNRAMDFPWKNNKTVREIYEPGPFLSSLKESRFSNHLGFNGFVELADNKFIFVKRDNIVSIGKSTLANSIGASYKTMYGLEDDQTMSEMKISDAIREEIRNELKIDISADVNLAATVFAFYRDIVEGGKPQFLFYYKCDAYDSVAFEKHFKSAIKNRSRKKNKNNVDIDGTEFVFFTLDELKKCTYTINGFTSPDNKKYTLMPSATASVIMLLKHLS